MPQLLQVDDIPAGAVFNVTPQFGLPLVPRGSTQALAAVNAISRILEERALKNHDGVSTGTSTFQLLTSDYANISNLDAGHVHARSVKVDSGNFSNITSSYLSVLEGTISTFIAEDIKTYGIEADNITAVSVLADLVTTDDLVVNTAEIETLNVATINYTGDALVNKGDIPIIFSDEIETTEVTSNILRADVLEVGRIILNGVELATPNIQLTSYSGDYLTTMAHLISLQFYPDIVEYTLTFTDASLQGKIQGTIDAINNTATYDVLYLGSTEIVNHTFTGFPLNSQGLLYTLTLDEGHLILQGFNRFEFSNHIEFNLYIKAQAYPRTTV